MYSAFRTASDDVVFSISQIMLIDISTDKLRNIYNVQIAMESRRTASMYFSLYEIHEREEISRNNFRCMLISQEG